MDCPYCGKQMTSGYLQSARGIIWSQEKKKALFKATKPGDIEVSEGFWNGCFAPSYRCWSCALILTPFDRKK